MRSTEPNNIEWPGIVGMVTLYIDSCSTDVARLFDDLTLMHKVAQSSSGTIFKRMSFFSNLVGFIYRHLSVLSISPIPGPGNSLVTSSEIIFQSICFQPNLMALIVVTRIFSAA